MASPVFKPASFGFYRPHDRVEERGELVDPATGVVTIPPSMTKQSHRDECDINNILKQFKKTGIVRHISARAAQGAYQDLPDPIDFQDALHMVMQAEQAFEDLPSVVRSRFNNDPAAFLAFTSDPANAAELVELGLATAQAQEPGPVTPPAPTPPSSPGDGGTGG